MPSAQRVPDASVTHARMTTMVRPMWMACAWPRSTSPCAAPRNRVSQFTVRQRLPRVQAAVERLNPAYYDILPLSLEEIFIYELGGAAHETEGLLL